MTARPSRVALMLLPGLDHFAHDLRRALPAPGVLEIEAFHGPASLPDALAWADDPCSDALWFEFCWPPWPEAIARSDLGGRRVIVRVHRIEAYETQHAARAPWSRIDDAIVVSRDMARILREAAPAIDRTTRIHVLGNGVDLQRFTLRPPPPDRFRIGWCGSMILRKNPALALEILHRLLQQDGRYTLHLAFGMDDRITPESFFALAERMGVGGAIRLDGAVAQSEMPAWHALNAVLLSTSLHESFGYAIAEAAATGCDIAVLDHLGADEFWPDATRFGAVDEACRMIRGAGWGRWRKLVVERFALDRQIDQTRMLLAGSVNRSEEDRRR